MVRDRCVLHQYDLEERKSSRPFYGSLRLRGRRRKDQVADEKKTMMTEVDRCVLSFFQ